MRAPRRVILTREATCNVIAAEAEMPIDYRLVYSLPLHIPLLPRTGKQQSNSKKRMSLFFEERLRRCLRARRLGTGDSLEGFMSPRRADRPQEASSRRFQKAKKAGRQTLCPTSDSAKYFLHPGHSQVGHLWYLLCC